VRVEVDMLDTKPGVTRDQVRPSAGRRRSATVALLTVLALSLSGCSDATKNRFLAAALEPLGEGALRMFQGLIDGFVAITMPQAGEPGMDSTGQ
jgi:hypothetical protein